MSIANHVCVLFCSFFTRKSAFITKKTLTNKMHRERCKIAKSHI